MSAPPLLVAHDVTKTYTSTEPPTQVLHGIDLSVAEGEFVAVMGASGSGKSTLLFALSGMDRPTSGTVTLEGTPLTGLDDKAMSRLRLTRMGFVFQQPYFLANLDIRDNILLPALKARPRDAAAVVERVDTMLASFEIAGIADHSITEVSGGQLQRASLCRALAGDPAIIFADEPTGALNSAMARQVMDTLGAIHADGATIVLVTHDPACAARADRVIYLKDGLIRAERRLGPWEPAAGPGREGDLLTWLHTFEF